MFSNVVVKGWLNSYLGGNRVCLKRKLHVELRVSWRLLRSS